MLSILLNDGITTTAIVFTTTLVVTSYCVILHHRRKFKKSQVDFLRALEDDSSCSSSSSSQIVGFFHPYCSSGGGGERVLWKMIEVLGNHNNEETAEKDIHVIVYTIDKPSPSYKADLLNHVSTRFCIDIPSSLPLTFVHLHEEFRDIFPDPSKKQNRKFSLLMESIDTMKLAWKALQRVNPHVYIDTTGYAFTYLVAYIFAKCDKIVAYVHYPTISTDMLSLVWQRRPSYNNDSQITQNRLMTYIKLIYYSFFSLSYGIVGSLADVVMVNSSWTYAHIKSLWRFQWIFGKNNPIQIVFPPCDVKDCTIIKKNEIGSNNNSRDNIILSIGQFRPEKDHELQIRSFALFLEMLKEVKEPLHQEKKKNMKLVLIGSCRNESDKARVDFLQNLSVELKIPPSQIEFVLNQPWSLIEKYFMKASVGIHTMWNEHFGIGVVEMMNAGLVVIAHNSAGPKMNIVLSDKTRGYLAGTAKEYAETMYYIFCVATQAELDEIRVNAIAASLEFSDLSFERSIKKIFDSFKVFAF